MVFDRFTLDGKIAIVTGAGKGLGRTMALTLAGAGASVVAVARAQAGIQETVDRVKAVGSTGVVFPIDVCDSHAVDRLVNNTISDFGRIDILVNNARGEYGIQKSALETSDEEWDRILSTNLTGAFYCARAVGRQMSSVGYGRIINVSCINGVRGSIAHPALAAAKGGLNQLTQALALEWAKQGITVNTLGLGWFEDQLVLQEDVNAKNRLQRAIPIGRFGLHGDIEISFFLASAASCYMTGQSICLDGGILCRS